MSFAKSGKSPEESNQKNEGPRKWITLFLSNDAVWFR
jgi:hypothetical protein